jgi:predicted GNAT family acetyltransferase
VAGASADCEELWQIGVDVVEGQRGRGIGRAIVGRLTAEVLARGRVPYYSTVVSNLRSSRLALGLGYRLAWVELYARAPWPGATASAAGQNDVAARTR